MANSAQARKRVRRSRTQRTRNVGQRSALRTSIKQFIKALRGGDAKTATAAYRQASSSIDRAVSKKLHHKNRAARLKKRLNNRLRTLNT